MLEINWGDVVNIFHLCTPYFILFGAALIIAVAVSVAVRKKETAKKKLVRAQAGIAFLLATIIAINGICYGPMATIISLATGQGRISDETIDEAEETCEVIANEGIVLLKNEDGFLPLQDTKNLNVFGWASTNPCYGGTGSGALNDLYPRVTLLEGLEHAGFALNQELEDFYIDYRADHPTISPFVQDWTLPEPPVDTYSDELMANAKEFSDTALIVLSRTGAEHADLPTDVTEVDEIWAGSGLFATDYQDNTPEYEDFPEGTTFLEISQSERNMVELVCENFDNVIVIYNGSNAMELGFVNTYDEIKGVVWCAGPGQNGFNSLGNVLNGTVNPSGRTVDTFVADLTAIPSFNNFGRFQYDNMDEFAANSWGDPTSPTFVNYVEGIYVGYKFYETAAAEGLINYDEAVVYPFGYGLSYTDFSQEMGELSVNEDGTVSFEVMVTNTGDVAGKEVVEVYYTPPYTNGGIEKSEVNLVEFAKTGLLEPGESERVTISFALEDMASYDDKGAGCYVLEEGEYRISIRSDSHRIIADQTYELPQTITYDGDNQRSSDLTAAVNQLTDVAGDVEYLSRADGFANYERVTAPPSTYSLSDTYKAAFINTSNYDPAEHNDPNAEMPVTGADNGLELADMRGLAYDDPQWDTLLDQLTVDEMADLVAISGFSIPQAESVNMVSTINCDGPASINNNFTGVGSIGFPSETMLACTWSKEMAYEFGVGIGKMADEMDVSGWYAPAMNIHRNAFGGRNFEYYSEDGVLSGMMATNSILGAKEYGVYAVIKHFALNDQEYNRQWMLCTWCNEQAIREIYLKPFELAVKDGGAGAVMTAYNYVGVTWAGAKAELINNILRGEWGFQGFALTDSFGGHGYMNADQMIRNGGDCCLATYDVGPNYPTDTESATAVSQMRRASKNIMYTVVNSRAYSDANLEAGMRPWQMAGIAIDVVLAAGLIALEVLAVKKYRKRLAENDRKVTTVSGK